MPTVTSEPQPGTAPVAGVQPCAGRGLVVVTLQYPQGEPAHDVDVALDGATVSKTRNGATFVFEIAAEATHRVVLTTEHWACLRTYAYEGIARPEHTTSIVVPLRRRPSLTLVCSDHHFAPGPETLDAAYTTQGLGDATVRLTISGTEYGGDVAYRDDDVASGDGEHPLGYRGAVNVGALDGGLLTPLHSPYTIRVEAPDEGLHAEARFHVLYRDVTLALGTYTADGTPPVEATHPRQWIQHKLDALGYFAGPVDGTIANNGQTHRAMRRYAYEHPALQEGDANDAARFQTDAAFLTALRNDEHPRVILQGGALPPVGGAARGYIDHNYFYYELADFGRPAGHRELDQRKLDRFELPIEATVTLMSRTDANGTGAGVVSPRAVGEVAVEWKALEPPENTGSLLAPTANRPSRTRAYVNEVITQTEDAGDRRGNCPATLGGARAAPGTANQNYFVVGPELPPFTSTNAGDRVFSTAHQGATAVKHGKAGILFRGSTIAGDRYQLSARLSFHDRPNDAALQAAHVQVTGRAWGQILAAATGTITLWRKHRVSTVINWPAPPAGGPIQWADVAAEYRHAWCELDHAGIVTVTGTHLLANYRNQIGWDFQQAAGMMVTGGLAHGDPMNQIQFDGTCLYPLAVPAQGADEYARDYRRRAVAWADAEITLEANQNFAHMLAELVYCQRPPGTIVIHGKWIPTLTLQHRRWLLKTDTHTEQLDPGLHCIGLTKGVTVLANAMYPDYQHRFLVAHEMGHSRFLSHHETGSSAQVDPHGINNASDNPSDHDLRDHNCTMCYPWGVVTRQPLSWGPAAATQPGFCGKCILKLRGWDVANAAMPRQSPP